MNPTIRYTTKTKTVLFTMSGMNGAWSRWRNNRQASAEAAYAAVKEARNNLLTAYKRSRFPKSNAFVP